MDMQLYWVQYRICQGHYNVFWKPVATNLIHYSTKHHPTHQYHRMRPVYLHYSDNANNASARVFDSSQNTSINKIPTQDSNKEAHLKISKMETNIQTDGHTGRRTGVLFQVPGVMNFQLEP